LQHGFLPVESPAIEKIENLLGNKGGENEKLIFKILRRGLDFTSGITVENDSQLVDLGLRYDLTVPLARYYSHYGSTLPKPFKTFQIGPVWRAERPQKARYRQFTQCDLDIIGEPGSQAELELIVLILQVLGQLGFTELECHLNHRGWLAHWAKKLDLTPEEYRVFLIVLDKLDKKVLPELLAEMRKEGLGEKKIEAIQATLNDLLQANEPAHLWQVVAALGCPEAYTQTLQNLLRDADTVRANYPGFKLVFNPTLVRGMDYYTGPIFEVRNSRLACSIAGGGRYDAMIGSFSGEQVPACGFSIGFERIADLLAEAPITISEPPSKLALLYDEAAQFPEVLNHRQTVMQNQLWQAIGLYPRQKNFSHQLARLQDAGFTHWAMHCAPGNQFEIHPMKTS
jgi:histidyl-tRNA synthetase